ncbi:methyltransferase domain-containing protein [Naumannella sp. ID2617S]|nr:methyltransferase domain-containing protein [Naumannella sp. ID2617S]
MSEDQSARLDDYFAEQYAGAEDPWGFTSRWYERRKYTLTLAALPRARYRSAFEPGCSIGVLTAGLAERCDRLLSVDLVPQAVARARVRVPAPHVRLAVGDLRDPWPDERFDLVVLSEVAYYLQEEQVERLAQRARAALTDDGHLVTVHWRHPVAEHRLSGDRADALLRRHLGLTLLAEYRDDDFVMTVQGRQPVSVARAEGLVADATAAPETGPDQPVRP